MQHPPHPLVLSIHLSLAYPFLPFLPLLPQVDTDAFPQFFRLLPEFREEPLLFEDGEFCLQVAGGVLLLQEGLGGGELVQFVVLPLRDEALFAGEVLLEVAGQSLEPVHCQPEVLFHRLPLLQLLCPQLLVQGHLLRAGETADGLGDAQSLGKSLNIGFDLADALLFLSLQSLYPHHPRRFFSLLLDQPSRDLACLCRAQVGVAQDEVVAGRSLLLPVERCRLRLLGLLGVLGTGRGCGREGVVEGAGRAGAGPVGDLDGGVGGVRGEVVLKVVHVVRRVAAYTTPYFMQFEYSPSTYRLYQKRRTPHSLQRTPATFLEGGRGTVSAGLQKMFQFLNKLSHNHASPVEPEQVAFQQLSSEEDGPPLQRSASQKGSLPKQSPPRSPRKLQTIDRPDRSTSKPLKRGESIVGKMQMAEKLQISPEASSILEEALAGSERDIGGLLREKVRRARVERERKVFIREMARDEEEYLEAAGRASQAGSSYLQQGLSSTLAGIVDQISHEIELADMPIRMRGKKADPEGGRKQEMLRLIKLRESELQDKIGELSVEFRLDEEAGEVGREEFDPDSVKTRMAEEFVREKQREREEKKARLEEYRERRRVLEAQVREEQAAREEEARQQRHEQLVREFAEKQRAKREEVQRSRTEEVNYKQFLKEYKQLKPLYQKKEEEFQARLKEEKKERYHALKDKQAKYEPLNIELLEMHEERYEELRREDRERKEAEMELARQKEHLLKKQLDEKIYKGRFRYRVLQEMVDAEAKKREKEAERQAALVRKQAYSLEVKHHFQPTVDPAKRHQIQQVLNSHKQRQRKFMTPNRVAYSDHYSTISSHHHPFSEPEADPKKEGEKYHRLFKQYIRGKIEKGEVKSEEEAEEKPPAPRPDYLRELREKYEGHIPSKSTRLERQIEKLKDGEDYRALILKAEEFEGKAKQREVKLRNVAHVPAEEAMLEEDYLCAIKAKMQLINHMD